MEPTQPVTLNLGRGDTLELTPGVTRTIMVGSLTHPAGHYQLTVSISKPSHLNPNTLVSVGCNCPQNRFKGTCKHMAIMLDVVSLQIHGERHEGSPWVTIPDTTATTNDDDGDIWAGLA